MSKTLQETKIECTKLTVEIPKILIPLLEHKASLNNSSVKEEAEYYMLDSIRAEMEGMEGMEFIEFYKAGPVFYELFGDERFKPEEKTEIEGKNRN